MAGWQAVGRSAAQELRHGRGYPFEMKHDEGVGTSWLEG